ncbi:uncharacterized protein BN727_02295 [Bacteroides sp. CAG:598]|nr:uncharacterized protein BN727_02295 [Bacteroides sp. CAG:598]
MPKIKAIYMSELAQRYFPRSTPRSAMSQLHRWINLNTDLKQRLKDLHFAPRQRALTPLQHEAILFYLGEPGE